MKLFRGLFMAVAELSRTAPRPEVNYRAVGSLRFGKYNRETVMPRWWVEQSGHSAEKLVRDGHIEETIEPVIEDFIAPAPKSALDSSPAIAEENNTLRQENSRVRAENKGLAANNDALRSDKAKLTVALTEVTADKTHWQQQAEAHRAALVMAEKKINDLESELELERTTKPPAEVPAKKTK